MKVFSLRSVPIYRTIDPLGISYILLKIIACHLMPSQRLRAHQAAWIGGQGWLINLGWKLDCYFSFTFNILLRKQRE